MKKVKYQQYKGRYTTFFKADIMNKVYNKLIKRIKGFAKPETVLNIYNILVVKTLTSSMNL